jgi:hypothetical protein
MAWHLGKRTVRHTVDFTEKLHEATEGRFQLTTDGFAAYPDAVAYSSGTRVDFSQLVKVYAASHEGQRTITPLPLESIKAQLSCSAMMKRES